jgi:CHASE2 domain-containing sensor protein
MPPVRETAAHGMPDLTSPADAAHPAEHAHPHSVFRELVFGLAMIALVVFLKIQFEHTDTGQWLRLATYDLLQTRLAEPKSALPVAVLDISELPSQPQTPRRNLRELVAALKACEPRAGGVDIDFSPDPAHPLSPADRDFFDLCLQAKREGVPV